MPDRSVPSWRRNLAVASVVGCVAGALVGCGGSSAAAPNDGGSDVSDAGGGPDSPQCGAVGISPATINVVSAAGGAIPCTATFTVVGADGGNDVLCGTPGNLCTLNPQDGGTQQCSYSIFVSHSIGEPTPVTVDVSQSGFVSQLVPDVFDGITGCIANPIAASTSTVTLQPITDAGAVVDGSTD